ncbi:MAG: alpha/beta fold hydrolase, partial [Chloroflexia bacterium]|nr:alpha/beta fold hydrolase [Chloroflexia bacterium]
MTSDGQGQDRVKAPYRWHHSLLLAIVTASLVLTMPGIAGSGARASPPPQPVEGPGGSAYAFDAVETSRSGNLPTGAWVFAPEGTSDVERGQMPVVLLLHGFGATDPQTYRGWISHLVRRGHIVIYPDYQPEGFLVFDQSTFVANMLAGLEQGLDKAGLEPETIHVVGHSLGAVMGAAYLRAGPLDDLPPVASLTLIAPGGCSTCGTTSGFGVPLPDDLAAPEELLVNIVV